MQPRDVGPTDHELFVVPRGRGSGFQASVRGHVLQLVDPDAYALAPTADDLFVVSIASAVAWAARRFLRESGLPDYVSVSAKWATHADRRGPADVDLTVTVAPSVDATRAALVAVVDDSIAAHSLAKPCVHISLKGVNP